MQTTPTVSVSVDQRDIDRIVKRLDKQGSTAPGPRAEGHPWRPVAARQADPRPGPAGYAGIAYHGIEFFVDVRLGEGATPTA